MTNKIVFDSIITSIIVSGLATIISFIVAVLISFILHRKRNRFTYYLEKAFYICSSLPPVLIGLVVFLALSKKGVFGDFKLLFTKTSMVIAQTLLVTPIMISVIMSQSKKEFNRIYNCLVKFGASKTELIMTIIKELSNVYVSSLVTGFGRAISEVGAVILVGGNIASKTRTMTTMIALNTSMGNFNHSLLIGGVLLMLSTLTNIVLLRLKDDKYEN